MVLKVSACWFTHTEKILKGKLLRALSILRAISTNKLVHQPVYERQWFRVMDAQCNGFLEVMKKVKLIFQILNINEIYARQKGANFKILTSAFFVYLYMNFADVLTKNFQDPENKNVKSKMKKGVKLKEC